MILVTIDNCAYPKDTIQKWQSQVSKFILTDESDPLKRRIITTNNQWEYAKAKAHGLQIPHIQKIIEYQRLQMLQKICSASLP